MKPSHVRYRPRERFRCLSVVGLIVLAFAVLVLLGIAFGL
jgi:hypothetical protein